MYSLTQSAEYSVEVFNLLKKFGDFTAVDDISFAVKKGEVFGFLGPNGAGKSTTIRMLCGIIAPTSGRGTVGGLSITGDLRLIKQSIGYMSQKFSLYEDLSPFENLNFYSGVYPIERDKRKARVAWALALAGLEDRQDDLTGNLSGGQKQRLALACALLHEPDILFLDEPTAGVDPLSRRNFWEIIYNLSRSGVTVFVTTHYMDEAEHCDRIGFINSGRLIKIGSPKELKLSGRKLVEIRCGDWLAAFQILKEHEQEIGESTLFGTSIHLAPKEDGEAKMTELLEQRGVKIKGIRRIAPTLEDVFVELLKGA
jgi:ABC-2 type transport system ATP-binding protein